MRLLWLSLVGLTSSSPVFNCHPVVTSRRCLRLTALQGSDNLTMSNSFCQKGMIPLGVGLKEGVISVTLRSAESIYMFLC